MKKREPGFTYWKRPWIKWVLLIGAAMECVNLFTHIRDYQITLTTGIMSPEAWAVYAPHQVFSCVLDGLLAACFLGAFLIGLLAGSFRGARLAEGVLLLLLGVVLGVSGVLFFRASGSALGLFWVVVAVFALGVSFFSFRKYRRTPRFGISVQ